jgi:hypothetical protein
VTRYLVGGALEPGARGALDQGLLEGHHAAVRPTGQRLASVGLRPRGSQFFDAVDLGFCSALCFLEEEVFFPGTPRVAQHAQRPILDAIGPSSLLREDNR